MHRWTPDEDALIKRQFNRGYNRSLSVRLGVDYHVLVYRAGKLGLRKKASEYHWSKKEDEKLLRLSKTCCAASISRLIGRSVVAINARRLRLGITNIHRAWYTLEEVQNILGCGYRVVQRYIANKELRAIQNGDSGHVWKVSAKDLKLFIRTYPYSLVGRNVDIVQIIEIVATGGINHSDKNLR